MRKHRNPRPETLNVQALRQIDAGTGGLTPAIFPSTTYVRDRDDYALLDSRHSYGRDENPGFVVAEQVLARLEGGEAGLLFSSGMSAAMAIIQSLKPGDRVVAPRIMYWGLRRWLIAFCDQWGLALDLFDPADPDALARSVERGKTRLLWMESPCNPTWEVIDIAAAADIAHGIGATLVVDSTVATPVLTQPILHGADLVVHSATKYLNGHCDVVAGAVVTARKDELWEDICHVRLHGGAILGTFEAWLLQRGMRTLFLRVHKASESALAIARQFEGHPALKGVLYPGLPSHPGHEIAKRQMDGGFGGMLSLRVQGDAEKALDIVKRCRVFTRATSLGGVESLIEHRYSIEGENSPIPEDLVRLSIGIEDVDDLIADLEQALA
ncbi:MAG: aminotransferase class I/II-fold pyridoxal phosphate-dependent enzyme [Gammaproteobacteria bacterium]|nr:aminotransferase class I/II-fold pyridoxal phosphate-dependent enzyme [Gammaproteobacteria bacterium]